MGYHSKHWRMNNSAPVYFAYNIQFATFTLLFFMKKRSNKDKAKYSKLYYFYFFTLQVGFAPIQSDFSSLSIYLPSRLIMVKL